MKLTIILVFLLHLVMIAPEAAQANTLQEGNLSEERSNDSRFAFASWWLTKAYFAEQSPPDIVILGGSQLGPVKAADAYVYNSFVDLAGDHRSHTIEHDLALILHKNWRVLVGGLPGAMVSDQLIISRALFTDQYKPKLVIIMFSPRDFIDNNKSSVTDSEAFSFFSKYTNLGADSILFFTGQKHEFDRDQLHSTLSRSTLEAAYIESTKLHAISSNYSDRISSLTLGKPFERICLGQSVICPGTRYLFYDSSEDYRRRYKNPFSHQFTLQLRCLAALFRCLKQQHIAVAAVEMPLTNTNHILLPETFWQFYKNQIGEICNKYDVDYWDTELIWDNDIRDYCDSVHQNLVGGLKLTRPIVLATACKFRFPMYAFNANFGPLVPGKEKLYFRKSWTDIMSAGKKP